MGLIRNLRARTGKRMEPQKRPPEGVRLDAAGMSYGEISLRRNEGICSAVTRLANAFSCMPVHLYQDFRIRSDDPLERLVAFAPNPNQTPHDFQYTMMASLAVYGYAYALIVPDGLGGVDRLDVIDPPRVQPRRNIDTGEIWYQIRLDDGSEAYVHTSAMIAVRFSSTDGVHSVSPLEVLGATLKYDRAIKEISLKQLEGVNGAVVLTYPTALSEDKKIAIENRFINAYKKSTGQVLILEGGVTADRIAGSVVDPQVLSSDSITKSKIAAVYNMPLRLVGANVNSDYSTSEQAVKEFMTLTMLPWVTAFEQEYNRKLLMWSRYARGERFHFSMEAMMRGDIATMTERHSKGVRGGKMTPNEARAEDYLPPMDYGDELMSARDLIPLRIAVSQPDALLGYDTGKGGEAN